MMEMSLYFVSNFYLQPRHEGWKKENLTTNFENLSIYLYVASNVSDCIQNVLSTPILRLQGQEFRTFEVQERASMIILKSMTSHIPRRFLK
jgi:hypothetical protein